MSNKKICDSWEKFRAIFDREFPYYPLRVSSSICKNDRLVDSDDYGVPIMPASEASIKTFGGSHSVFEVKFSGSKRSTTKTSVNLYLTDMSSVFGSDGRAVEQLVYPNSGYSGHGMFEKIQTHILGRVFCEEVLGKWYKELLKGKGPRAMRMSAAHELISTKDFQDLREGDKDKAMRHLVDLMRHVPSINELYHTWVHKIPVYNFVAQKKASDIFSLLFEYEATPNPDRIDFDSIFPAGPTTHYKMEKEELNYGVEKAKRFGIVARRLSKLYYGQGVQWAGKLMSRVWGHDVEKGGHKLGSIEKLFNAIENIKPKNRNKICKNIWKVTPYALNFIIWYLHHAEDQLVKKKKDRHRWFLNNEAHSHLIDFFMSDGKNIAPSASIEKVEDMLRRWEYNFGRARINSMLSRYDGTLDNEFPVDEAAYKKQIIFESWVFNRLSTPRQLVEEGADMEHCVGTYVHTCEKGDSVIYSGVCAKSGDRCTVELSPKCKSVVQIQGRKNSKIADRGKISRFFNEIIGNKVQNSAGDEGGEDIRRIKSWELDRIYFQVDEDKLLGVLTKIQGDSDFFKWVQKEGVCVKYIKHNGKRNKRGGLSDFHESLRNDPNKRAVCFTVRPNEEPVINNSRILVDPPKNSNGKRPAFGLWPSSNQLAAMHYGKPLKGIGYQRVNHDPLKTVVFEEVDISDLGVVKNQGYEPWKWSYRRDEPLTQIDQSRWNALLEQEAPF